MKKIINWTIGSFLRTISRIIAYLIVGFILALLCNKIGINLFIPTVHGATIRNWSSTLPALERAQVYDCNTSNQCNEVGGSLGGITLDDDSIRVFYSSNGVNVAKGGTAIQLSTPNLKPGYLYNVNAYVCFNKSVLSGNYRIYSHNYSTPGVSDATELGTTRNGLSNAPGNGDQTFNNCQLFSGLFVPEVNSSWTALRITNNTTISSLSSNVVSVETKELGIYTDTIKQIIENSNGSVVEAVDKVTEETKKTNETLNDTDVTDSTTEASDFFNNFDTGDTGSLMNLISLPLNFLNRLNSSCKPVNLPVPHFSNINLPCMSTIYAAKNDLKPVFDTIRLIINGLICYKCLRSLIYFISELKDPEQDNLEVLDL